VHISLDVVYVPIGLGSGICEMLSARDALNLKTEVVGLVSAHANAYAKSFNACCPIESPVTIKLSDGMACRIPEPAALELIL
jgi:threonine dehydratase